MKNLVLIAVLALVATGCASRGSVADLSDKVDMVSVQAANANAKADEANANANEALRRSAESDIKLDRMFEKSMYK